jgi:hypothetical protein
MSIKASHPPLANGDNVNTAMSDFQTAANLQGQVVSRFLETSRFRRRKSLAFFAARNPVCVGGVNETTNPLVDEFQ